MTCVRKSAHAREAHAALKTLADGTPASPAYPINPEACILASASRLLAIMLIRFPLSICTSPLMPDFTPTADCVAAALVPGGKSSVVAISDATAVAPEELLFDALLVD